MESHQNLYTHAVDSAIQLQGNNKVLKERPPPISDEEQRLNRRQRCTLSQVRSGHCHLFTNARNSSFKKIETAQNASLKMATGTHKIASIDHLHQESLTLKVNDHSDMLSAQYLVKNLEEDHVCHSITTREEPRPRPMKETLHSRHHSTVHPRLGSSRMESHQNMYTHAVD